MKLPKGNKINYKRIRKWPGIKINKRGGWLNKLKKDKNSRKNYGRICKHKVSISNRK